MEEALSTLKLTSSISEYNAALKILHTYAKNIVNNPTNEKYRKIRIENPKFNSAVWRFDAARMVMLLAGFEEEGEFLVLPSNIDLSFFYGLLSQKVNGTGSSSNKPDDAVPSSSKHQVEKASTLKLFADKGASMFEEEIKPDMTLLSYLVEMGYAKHVAEQGLVATKNKGVQPAMDWISTHPEAIQNVKKKDENPTGDTTPNSLMGIMETSPNEATSSISSRYGKYMDERHKYQEKIRLEAIKKAKIEKEEDRRAKLMLKKNLEAERNQTKQKFQQQSQLRHSENEKQSRVPSSPVDSAVDPSHTRIRIKLPDGNTEVWETPKSNLVEALYNHVYSLCPNIPTEDLKIISPSTHQMITNDGQSLEIAGLSPSATVIVHRVQKEATHTPVVESPDNTQPSDSEQMGNEQTVTDHEDSNNDSIT